MKNQTYRMTMLYDFYGDLLTDRQKEFYDLYYNEDLSLAEIAENFGITRQGVRDIVVRAESSLLEVEEKTGLIARFHAEQSVTVNLQAQLDQIRSLNDETLSSRELDTLCNQMQDSISALRRESPHAI
ncbi:MAG: YlxM family DNA-binding protein [Evtepia sp.]